MTLSDLYHKFVQRYGQQQALVEFLATIAPHIDRKAIDGIANRLRRPGSNIWRKPAPPVHDPRNIFGSR